MRALKKESVGVNQVWGIIRSEWVAWISISIIWLPYLFKKLNNSNNNNKKNRYKEGKEEKEGGKESVRKRATVSSSSKYEKYLQVGISWIVYGCLCMKDNTSQSGGG